MAASSPLQSTGGSFKRVALCALSIVLVVAAAHPQDAATNTLSARSTLVVLPALVRDRTGHPVFGLHAQDFLLTDDGVPQTLTLEDPSDGRPLALVVVIQAGAATQSSGWHPGSRAAPPDRFQTLPTMIEALSTSVPHRIAVVGFDSQPELLRPFTANLEAVADTIHDFDEEDKGDHGASILDSLAFAVDLLRKQPPDYRRAILLLSETRDRGSKIPLEAALRAIGETNTAIYSIAYSTPAAEVARYGAKELPTKRVPPRKDQMAADPLPPGTTNILSTVLNGLVYGVAFVNPNPYPPGGCMGKDPNPDARPESKLSQGYDCLGQLAPPLALLRMATIAAVESLHRNTPEAVARLTGGEYFPLTDARTLERDLATIANHIPNRYLLSFQPHAPHPGLHHLQLRLRDPATLQLTARSSYWAD